jgi:nucleotide-binding universal stress UspA family protein
MIVVGVDGSEPSREALRWAFDEAKLRRTSLRVLHVWLPPPPPPPAFEPGVVPVPLPQELEAWREAAERFLPRLVDEVLPEREGVEVELVAEEGFPARELVRHSEQAELLVVGSRGHGGFAALMLGSVSLQVAHHSACPVTIVRPGGR